MRNTVLQKVFLPLLLISVVSRTYAQAPLPSPVGEYALRGVMETASGFALKADSTFEFFFSYGALDRAGKGRWRTERDSVVLNSGPKPAQDFKLRAAQRTTGKKIAVQLTQMDDFLRRHVTVRITGGNQRQEATADAAGRVSFALQPVDTVELLFEFCPEKTSVFRVPPGNRLFLFSPEPWLFEVFFQNFRLAQTADGLSGGHPLSDKTDFVYEKQR